MSKSQRRVFLLVVVAAVLLCAVAMFSSRAGASSTPTPAPISTYIQWRDPAPKETEPPPVPFADMPLLYFYDEAHNTDCWVTFNHMAVSCLRRPAFWPCEARAER